MNKLEDSYNPYNKSIGDLEDRLETSVKSGLSSQEAQRRSELFGKNELKKEKKQSNLVRFLLCFKDPMSYLLIAATIISYILWVFEKDEPVPTNSIVIMLVLIASSILSFVQETKSMNSVAALEKLTSPTSTVIRDGEQKIIQSSDLVIGDILVLAEGDAISADARLVTASQLKTNESSLTGESQVVTKSSDMLDGNVALAERKNMVFGGTSVTQGSGLAIVTSTAMDTEVGKIASMLTETKKKETPIEKQIRQISKFVTLLVIAICVIVIITISVTQGITDFYSFAQVLIIAVSLAVAAVPEGMVAIMTFVLAVGVQKMAKKNAIVKELSSVEVLGSTNVICTDKTGTLTKNEMTVKHISTSDCTFNVSGTGYEPKGEYEFYNSRYSNDKKKNPPAEKIINASKEQKIALEQALFIGTVANVSALHNDNGTWNITGDPTEVALLTAQLKEGNAGLTEQTEAFKRDAMIQFTSDRKLMSVIGRINVPNVFGTDDKTQIVASKGAPDVLLSKCKYIQRGDKVEELTDADREDILNTVNSYAYDAYRTIAAAYKITDYKAGEYGTASGELIDENNVDAHTSELESDLIWCSIFAITDPPREDVIESIKEAKQANVRTVMITGDHPVTALKIGYELGIVEEFNDKYVMTGKQLDDLSLEEFERVVDDISIYARVEPKHKVKIVEALQDKGNIVAMTGDGVNDAPALKAADIGVAMGITGTQVAKNEAKMILADDKFSTIVDAIERGREIFENIQKVVRYSFSTNICEVMVVFFSILLANALNLVSRGGELFIPLLAVQILWMNLLTDGPPAFAMGIDEASENLMKKKPRGNKSGLVTGRMVGGILITGFAMTFLGLIAMYVNMPYQVFTGQMDLAHADLTFARTMCFTTLVFCQIINAFSFRNETRSAFYRIFHAKGIWIAVAISFIFQVIVLYVPLFNTAFGTCALPWYDFLECLAFAFGVLVISEIRKVVLRRYDRRSAEV